MDNQDNNNRRNFLRSILLTAGTLGLVSTANKKPTSENKEKIRMLTADGKLIEVDKSVIEKNTALKRASDKEVFEWMNKKNKT
jgi:phage repressor protein C with HTH and peptisase S24 domain